MSIIIGICSKNFCTFISDGRKIDPTSGPASKILDESFPKVFKVNNRVVLGGTGVFKESDRIVDVLNCYPVKGVISPRMAYQATVNYLENQASDLCVPRNYLIGGKNPKEGFSIYEIHFDPVNHKVETTHREPGSGFAISCSLPAGLVQVEGKIIHTIGEFIHASKTQGQMVKYVKQFLRELYALDFTIGGDVFDVTIA